MLLDVVSNKCQKLAEFLASQSILLLGAFHNTSVSFLLLCELGFCKWKFPVCIKLHYCSKRKLGPYAMESIDVKNWLVRISGEAYFTSCMD